MSSDYRNPYVPVIAQAAPATEEVPQTRYQALSGLAVGSLGFGLVSVLSIVSWLFVFAAAAGVLLGWLALRQIRLNREEMTGVEMAWAGIAASVILCSGGFAWNIYMSYFSVPAGYEPISFKMLQPDPAKPDQRVSDDAEMLDKRKVFIRGYMQPGRQKGGFKEFILVDDPGSCSFCTPTPRPTQLIRVKLAGSLKVNYTARLVAVGGEFSVHTDPREEGLGGLVYQIDADRVR
jgi:hypothetical protein